MRPVKLNTMENKLIAEFMGYSQPHPDYPTSTYWYKEGEAPLTILLFDTDWNWLMEVVDTIINLKNVYAQDRQKVFNSIQPNITTTYNEVVEFIKWYNEQNK